MGCIWVLGEDDLRNGGPFFGVFFLLFFFGAFSLFFLGRHHVPYILDGLRAISLGFPKKTFIPLFFLKRRKRRKEGRREGSKDESKETRKEEGRKEGSKEPKPPL